MAGTNCQRASTFGSDCNCNTTLRVQKNPLEYVLEVFAVLMKIFEVTLGCTVHTSKPKPLEIWVGFSNLGEGIFRVCF